jgi:hypothetical protein
MRRAKLSWIAVPVCVGLTAGVGCKKDEDEPPEQPKLSAGESCDPTVKPVEETEDTADDEDPEPICAPGLACDPVGTTDEYVCGPELQLRGRVTDSTTGAAIEGALVAALNENGEPVTDVVASDACGDYVLPVSVRRNPDGSFAEMLIWTLSVSARDYQPFPTGLRPALPVDMADAVPNPDGPEPPYGAEEDEEQDDDGETFVVDVIDNAATHVSLIPLGADAIGVAVSGSLGEGTAGTLVVAEGEQVPAPYGIADKSGHYTIFNVPAGAATIRGYRQNVEIEPATVTVGAADLEAIDLTVVATGAEALAVVSGSLNIVNADGGSTTSVVLVPASVFNAVLERGPVPLGLRDPPPPMAPTVSGAFSIAGVPAGTYKVLVAFENDLLVRDPDEGIAGTQIQEITVGAGVDTPVDAAFKVTQALTIDGPGNDAPEDVEAMPTFSWADDSSEDGYDVVVFDALGNLVWETTIDGVSGGDRVTLDYGGPALVPGMYYQFRVTSWREVQGDMLHISRTEDLRGVFVHGEAPPVAECTPPDEEEDEDGEPT